MTITDITRSLQHNQLSTAFADLDTNINLDLPVRPNKFVGLVDRNPLRAGIAFSELTMRMADNGPLSPEEMAYLPWLSVARRALEDLGVWRMDIEVPLGSASDSMHGACDLLLFGGPRRRGIGEFKLIRYGKLEEELPPRALAQLGAYVALADRKGDGSSTWGILVFAEIEQRMVKLRGVRSAKALVSRTLPLLELAA